MREVTTIKALNDALRQEMRRDEKVFIIGEDIWRGCFGVTGGLIDEFGDRVVSTPISEKAIVGSAVGAAIAGMIPVAELMFSDFLTCAYDEIINQAAKIRYMFGGQFNTGLVLRLPCGVSQQAAAQHSQSLEAVLTHIPGLKVVYPSNPVDAAGLLVSSIRDGNPIMFLEHKRLYNAKAEMQEGEILPIELGIGKIVKEGKALTILATGQYVRICKDIAEEYSSKGIDIEVIDPRCLVPFDKELLFDSVKKTGKLLVVTEETKRGAWSGEVIANVVEEHMDYLKKSPIRLGALDTPCPFSPALEEIWIPRKEDICLAIDTLCK
ncbi:MAG: alpha-ketoacid dehydrogenase subunit beta [Anaerovoracaceae bacterium]